MFNPGILLKGVLVPKLLNNPFASCFFVNIDFLFLHTEHCDNNNNLSFLVFITFELILSVFYLHIKQ